MPPDGEQIEETVGKVLVEIRDLLKAISYALTGQYDPTGLVQNANDWYHDRVIVAEPTNPVQIKPLFIPPGYELVIRALPDNTGYIFIGRTKELVLNDTRRIALTKNTGTELKINNANLVWVDAEVAGEGIDYWVELKS